MHEIIEWRKAVTLTMIGQGKDPYEIEETIGRLEPVVFSLDYHDAANQKSADHA